MMGGMFGIVTGTSGDGLTTIPYALTAQRAVTTLWLVFHVHLRRSVMSRIRIVVGAMLVLFGVVAALAQSSAPNEKADALAEAARKGDAAIVKTLLDEGVDVNTKYRYR